MARSGPERVKRMKLKTMMIKTMLVAAVACGAVAAYPAATYAAGTAQEAKVENHDHIYVRSQQMDYTTAQGQKMTVTVNANSDKSAMVLYVDLLGDKQRSKVEKNEDGQYVVTEGASLETDAAKIAETAAGNGQWREM